MKFPLDHKIKRPFVWVPAAATDVGATIRAEQKRLKALADARPQNVRQLKREAK